MNKIVTKILCNPTIQRWAEDKGKAWCIETITRFLSANPQYYYIVNWVLIVLTGISSMLYYMSTLGIVLPPITVFHHVISLSFLATKAAIFIPAAIRFGTQFSTKENTIGVTDQGHPIQISAAATRPYTAIIQAEKIALIGKAAIEEGK